MVGSKSASYIFLPILLKICFQQKWYVVGIMYSVEHLGLRWKTAWCFAWPDRLHQNWIRPGRNCGLLGRYETFQLLSSSHFRNWITLPRLYGYQIKSWPNQIWPKQIKLEKKKNQSWSYFPPNKKTLKRCIPSSVCGCVAVAVC